VTTNTPYPASGPRTVTLTVTDTNGQTNTSTQTIMVP
jgi:PKD repeat protein